MKAIVVTAALLVLGAVSCGGQSGEQSAHEQRHLTQWNNREGPTWAAYDKEWKAGWSQACDATVSTLLRKNLPAGVAAAAHGDCSLPPDNASDSASTYPPDFPRAKGRKSGLFHGCVDVYSGVTSGDVPAGICERIEAREYVRGQG
jgi:hypothetical protein